MDAEEREQTRWRLLKGKKGMKVAGNNEQGMMAEGINTRQGLKKKGMKTRWRLTEDEKIWRETNERKHDGT